LPEVFSEKILYVVDIEGGNSYFW